MTYCVYLVTGEDGTPCYVGTKRGEPGPGELLVNSGLTEVRAREIEAQLSVAIAKSRTLQ
jgi:hypothetical protein